MSLFQVFLRTCQEVSFYVQSRVGVVWQVLWRNCSNTLHFQIIISTDLWWTQVNSGDYIIVCNLLFLTIDDRQINLTEHYMRIFNYIGFPLRKHVHSLGSLVNNSKHYFKNSDARPPTIGYASNSSDLKKKVHLHYMAIFVMLYWQ